MRFFVDMALSPHLAAWLDSEGHDAVHAEHLGMSRSADLEIMQAALALNRVLITCDLDFPRLLATVHAEGPGLILLRGGNYSDSEAVECVRRVLRAIRFKELETSIVTVDVEKIRRRWLPI
jgi:predicted nuclease of predicted toxin-antitoxin system